MPPLTILDDGIGRFGGLIGAALGTLFTLAFIALVVVAIVYLLRRMRPAPVTAAVAGQPAVSPARTVLDERFARGEIDAEEYARRRAVLDGSA